jgi:hypothetical protein
MEAAVGSKTDLNCVKVSDERGFVAFSRRVVFIFII